MRSSVPRSISKYHHQPGLLGNVNVQWSSCTTADSHGFTHASGRATTCFMQEELRSEHQPLPPASLCLAATGAATVADVCR